MLKEKIDPNIVISLFNQGMGYGSISKKLDCGVRIIRNIFKKYNLKRQSGNYKGIDRNAFWQMLNIKETDVCWEWIGAVDGNGYGVVIINKKKYKTHRLAYELTNGEIPSKLFVCHKCDNKKCYNPNHLFLGTSRDNTIDCMKKDRHGTQKLKIADIPVIRQMVLEGVEVARIAREYNVQSQTIRNVINKRTWYYV